jgi:hypothetical protein
MRGTMTSQPFRARRRIRREVACVVALLLLSIGLLHTVSPHPQPQPSCKACQTLVAPLLYPVATGLVRPALTWSIAVPGPADGLIAASSHCLSPLRAPPESSTV